MLMLLLLLLLLLLSWNSFLSLNVSRFGAASGENSDMKERKQRQL